MWARVGFAGRDVVAYHPRRDRSEIRAGRPDGAVVAGVGRMLAAIAARAGVIIAPHYFTSMHRTGQRALERRGLTRSPGRNAVLLCIVPSRRKFAIERDDGAHLAVGQKT